MRNRLRSHIALSLMVLGAIGLVISASGATPGAPAWCWLVVLSLGIAAHVAVEAARQRQRLARGLRREMEDLKQGLKALAHVTQRDKEAIRAHVDQVGTPEGMKAFRDTVQKMANDLAPITEAFRSGKLTEALRSTVGRPR
jgi:hypothetical protein